MRHPPRVRRPWAIVAFAIVATTVMAAPPAEAGLIFSFSKEASTTTANYNSVLPAFIVAADRWSDIFLDDVTVNITIGYRALGSGILGQAGSLTQSELYSDVRSALVDDAKSDDDDTAVVHLPAGPALVLYRNTRNGTKFLDNDGSYNNQVLEVNTALAKALGLRPVHDAANDATIIFSSSFAWDFNPNNGIDASKYDLVGVATHEIGHALGFVSGVDIVDFYTGNGPNKNVDLNGGSPGIGELDPYSFYRPLDLYRYSATSIGAGTGVLDLATGGTSFFSIDGSTNLANFSTGTYNGDGRQASHWKDSLGLGVMDPTASQGELLAIALNDIRALDAVGWDIVPEPSGIMLAIAGLGMLTMLRVRKCISPLSPLRERGRG